MRINSKALKYNASGRERIRWPRSQRADQAASLRLFPYKVRNSPSRLPSAPKIIRDPYSPKWFHANDRRLRRPRPRYFDEFVFPDERRREILGRLGAVDLVVFDIDNTLIAGFLGQIYYRFMKTLGIGKTGTVLRRFLSRPDRLVFNTWSHYVRHNFLTFIALGALTLIGEEEETIKTHTEEFFRRVILNDALNKITPFIFEEARERIRMHKDAGHLVAFASASNYYPSKLLGDHLGADFVIGVRSKVRTRRGKNILTGKLDGPLPVYTGKRQLILYLLEQIKVPVSRTWFYTDDLIQDLPSLEFFGTSRIRYVTNYPWELAGDIQGRGFEVLRFDGQKTPQDGRTPEERQAVYQAQADFAQEQAQEYAETL